MRRESWAIMMSMIQQVVRPANQFSHTPPPHTLPCNQNPPPSGYPFPPYDSHYDVQDSGKLFKIYCPWFLIRILFIHIFGIHEIKSES